MVSINMKRLMRCDCRAPTMAHIDEKLRIFRHSCKSQSMIMHIRVPKKKEVHLCGVHKESAATGSTLMVVKLQDGPYYPVGDPFMEGNRFLQLQLEAVK